MPNKLAVKRRFVAAITLLSASCGGTPDGLIWKHRAAPSILPASFVFIDVEGPAVVGDIVVYCGGGKNGRISALRLRDGLPVTRRKVGWCFSPPLIVDDTIAVGFGSQPEHMVLKAIHIRDNNELWSRAFPREIQYATPIVFQGDIYLAHLDMLYRVTGDKGRINHLHVEECGTQQRAWVVADTTRLFFGCGARVHEVTDTGTTARFLFEIPENMRYPRHFTLEDSVLYVADDGKGAKLHAVNLNTGRVLWKHEGVSDGPTIVGNTAYAAAGFFLFAIDKQNGKRRWTSKVWSGSHRPLYLDGYLYSPDNHGVVRIDTATGRIVHRYAAKGEVMTTPVAVGDTLLYGDLKGLLYAVRR